MNRAHVNSTDPRWAVQTPPVDVDIAIDQVLNNMVTVCNSNNHACVEYNTLEQRSSSVLL